MEIVRLRADQVPEAAAVLARAFQDDPAWSWVLPSAARRAKAMPWLFEVGFELIEAEIWTTAGPRVSASAPARPAPPPSGSVEPTPLLPGGSVEPTPLLGCSRWLPPGRPRVRPTTAVRAFVGTPLRLREATSRFLAYGRAVDNLRRLAVPVPHWYLAGIGVEPAEQRRGVGGALLAPGLEAAERAGMPCALLTNSEQNLSFYEAHGFEVVLEGETPSGGPHAWMMATTAQKLGASRRRFLAGDDESR